MTPVLRRDPVVRDSHWRVIVPRVKIEGSTTTTSIERHFSGISSRTKHPTCPNDLGRYGGVGTSNGQTRPNGKPDQSRTPIISPLT